MLVMARETDRPAAVAIHGWWVRVDIEDLRE
jgi:hypothetical protein